MCFSETLACPLQFWLATHQQFSGPTPRFQERRSAYAIVLQIRCPFAFCLPTHTTTAMQQQILVGVIMGSSSDWDTMQHATQILEEFGVPFEARVVSAHRMPDAMFAYAEAAASRGLQAIIAGAGGAAHLPGMVAAKTTVPVLGVPVASRHLQGVDSLHSMVQMPKGVPVATFAIGNAGAANAALFAVALLANHDAALRAKLEAFRTRQTEAAQAMALPPA